MSALLRSIPLPSVIVTRSCTLNSLWTVARRGYRRVSDQRCPIFNPPFYSHQGLASKSAQYGQGPQERISHQLKHKTWLSSALRVETIEFAFKEFVSTLTASGLTITMDIATPAGETPVLRTQRCSEWKMVARYDVVYCSR